MAPPYCSARAIFLASLVLGLVACEPSSEPGPATCADREGLTNRPTHIPLTYSTEHIDIYVDTGRFLCAGTSREYEQHYQYIGEELGLELEGRVPLYLVEPGTISDYCGQGARGCRLRDGVVFSSVGAVFHELAHAAVCEWRSSAPPGLAEGLATSFEPELLESKEDPLEDLTQVSSTEVHYKRSGHFVRWLLEEYGPEPFERTYVAHSRSAGELVLDTLEEIYAEPAEDLVDTYLETAPDVWVPHRVCADVPTLAPVSEDAWSFSSVFDCESESTFGPWEINYSGTQIPEPKMYQSFLFEVATPGVYTFGQGDPDTELQIKNCIDEAGLYGMQAQDTWLQTGFLFLADGNAKMELTPGTYRMDVLRFRAPAHEVSVTIELTEG